MTYADLRTISIILCSPLGLPADEQLTVPLTTDEFVTVGSLLYTKLSLPPSAFLDEDPISLCQQLGLDGSLSSRIKRLLGRAGNLAFEQSTVTGQGIRIVSRREPTYPQQLITQLRNAEPPVLFVAGDSSAFPADVYGVALDASITTSLTFAEALLAQHRLSPVTYALDLDHPISGILLAEPDIHLVLSTTQPLSTLIRQKNYRVAIQNGNIALVSLTHPLSTHAQPTYKHLWLGFSPLVIQPLINDKVALRTIQPKTTFRHAALGAIPAFDHVHDRVVSLDSLFESPLATLYAAVDAHAQQPDTEAAVGVPPLLRLQHVDAGAAHPGKLPATSQTKSEKPVFGSTSTQSSKRKKKQHADRTEQTSLFEQIGEQFGAMFHAVGATYVQFSERVGAFFSKEKEE